MCDKCSSFLFYTFWLSKMCILDATQAPHVSHMCKKWGWEGKCAICEIKHFFSYQTFDLLFPTWCWLDFSAPSLFMRQLYVLNIHTKGSVQTNMGKQLRIFLKCVCVCGAECDEYIRIFEYSNILVTNLYSDIRSYQFFFYEYIRTFVRVKFVCTNIFRHSLVSVLECKT